MQFGRHYVERTVEEQPYAGRAPAEGVALSRAIGGVISELASLDPTGMRILVVTVERDDGMSWSATAAAQRITEQEDEYELRPIAAEPPPEGHSRLEDLGVRWNRIARLARRRGRGGQRRLTAGHRWLTPGGTLLLVGAFVLLAVLGGIAAALGRRAPDSGPWTDVLTTPAVLGPAVIAALVALLQPLVTKRLTGRSAAKESLLGNIESAESLAPNRHAAFVRDVARDLGKACAGCCVVIENPRKLDPLAQAVVKAYLDAEQPPVRGRQLWIVFEHPDDPILSQPLGRGGHAFLAGEWDPVRGIHYAQPYLDGPSRQSLAELHGHPPQPGYPRPVKLIVRGTREASPRTGELLLEWRAENGRTGSGRDELDLLHLLAVTEITGRGVYFSKERLSGTMASHVERPGRYAVLQAILRGPLPRRELTQMLERIDTDPTLQLLIERHPRDVYEVAYDAAQALVGRRALDFADVGLCHLFWAIYWHERKRRAPEAFWISKIAGHAREAATPQQYDLHAGLTDALVQATLHAARGYVRGIARHHGRADHRRPRGEPAQGLLPLLSCARELVELAEDPARATRDVRRLSWQAYCLLGDEEVLRSLLLLEAAAADEPSAGTAANELHRLFVQTMVLERSEPGWRENVLRELLRLDRPAGDLAAVRAAWLALTLGGATDHTLPPQIAGALERADEALPELVSTAVLRLESDLRQRLRRDADADGEGEGEGEGGDRGLAVDVAIAAMGCWSLALAARRGRIPADVALAALGDVYVLANYLPRPDRRPPGIRQDDDFVREGLEQELLLVAGAAAALLDRLPLEDPERRDAGDLMRVAAGAMGRRTDRRTLEREIERRMGLSELLWERLGFQQLRQSTSLRRAQFVILVGDDTFEEAHELAMSLAGRELDEAGAVGLLARTIVAGGDLLPPTAAAHLCRGVELALAVDLGAELADDLCFIALAASTRHRTIPRELVLARLLAPEEQTDSELVLDRWLRGLDEDRVTTAFVNILNAIDRPAARPFVDAALASLRAAPARAEARRWLEVDILRRALQAGEDVELPALIEHWEGYGQDALPQYVWALELVLFHGKPDAPTLRAALGVLEEYSQVAPQWNTFILAKDVLRVLTYSPPSGFSDDERDKGIEDAVAYAANGYPALGDNLGDTHRPLLDLLIRHDADRADYYREKLEEFDQRTQNEALARYLVPAKRNGRNFAVVWHYAGTLAAWGFVAHPDIPVGAIAAMTRDECAREVRRRLPNDWPDPFADGPNGRTVAADFLVAGHALLDTELDDIVDTDDYKRARARMEQRSEEMLDEMLGLAIDLPSLPETMRSVLRRHREALMVPVAGEA